MYTVQLCIVGMSIPKNLQPRSRNFKNREREIPLHGKCIFRDIGFLMRQPGYPANL